MRSSTDGKAFKDLAQFVGVCDDLVNGGSSSNSSMDPWAGGWSLGEGH